MKRTITFYNSFEEQEEDRRRQQAALTTNELMLSLRKLINFNFGLKGFDIDNLPKKHCIKISDNQSA